ncbi:MAG TPA: transposase [Syntrophorhabdaceae bacterium]|nr:transposase [Syntrophorhabdaceae bacterium]
MARPLRIEYANALYYITSKGNEKRSIFVTEKDYQRFKECLKEAEDRYGFVIHCYVLLKKEYHLIAGTPKANLSNVMHHINGSYAAYFNQRKHRRGHLFRGRFKAVLIDPDNYILELSRYLHLMPVKANVVKRPERYRFSSYKSYIYKTRDELVHRDLIRRMAPLKKYKRFIDSAKGVELKNPFDDVFKSSVLGDRPFVNKIMRKLDIEANKHKTVDRPRASAASVSPEKIIKMVGTHFDTDVTSLQKGIYRNLAIYLVKKYTGVPNHEIGELFGGISYSAVPKVYRRFADRLSKDNDLRKETRKIEDALKHVKR